MALHFTREEFDHRQRRARDEMTDAGLDGLLIFRQESMYYLTGYDTSGFSMFQAMYLGADGALALVTRSADRRQARATSVIEDVRIWNDSEAANPAEDVRDMLESHGCRGKRLGVEYHAYGLTGQRSRLVDATLGGFCDLVDASDLVRLMRLVKSPAELEYVRRAGALTDRALAVANKATVPGASIGAIYGEMLNTMLRGGGDVPCGRWPMGGGEEALLVRYHTGHGQVADDDQVTFEFAGAYRHYHTALMRVVLTGQADPRHEEHVQGLPRRARGLPRGARAGSHRGRGLRHPRPRLDQGGPRRALAQRLRLHHGRDLPADLDGLADVLHRQSAGCRAGHGLLLAHDPGGQRGRSRHVPRRDRPRHRSGLRARLPRALGPRGQLGAAPAPPAAPRPWPRREVRAKIEAEILLLRHRIHSTAIPSSPLPAGVPPK